jgi:hypothetical protein
MRRIGVLLFALCALLAPALAMDNPGPFNLGNFIVAAAGTQCSPVPVINLQGLDAVTLQVRFAYGSGGTQTNVFIQTSVDQGQSFFDIANIEFTTSSGVELVNLSGLNSVTTPTAPSNLALSNNTVLNGPIGDRLQACVVSTGTYAGQTLVAVNGVAR